MELSIACPLCSQPGFSDVNSLWLTLIRATTRQLTCPICQEVLCGLDKLTIHLVSHSLHDQLVQACAASSFLPPTTSFTKSSDLTSAAAVPSQESIGIKQSAPLASYVLINFPQVENVPLERTDQTLVAGLVEERVSSEEKLVHSMSSEETRLPMVLNCKSEDCALVPGQITPAVSECIADNENSPIQCLTQHRPFRNKGSCFNLSPTSKERETPSSGRLSAWNRSSSQDEQQINRSCSENCIPQLSQAFSMDPDLNSARKEITENSCGDTSVGCSLCGLSFKDNNIAMLHEQLIHNLSPQDNKSLSPPKNDDKHSSKQCNSKRASAAGPNRDGAGSLHRFPCHVCNKVFRMRGSLMVHLRVAHSPSGAVGLASRLSSTSANSKLFSGDMIYKLPLQNLSIQDSKVSFPPDLLKSVNGRLDHVVFEQTSCTDTSAASIQCAINEQIHAVSNQLTGNDCNKSPIGALSPSLSPAQSPGAQLVSNESTGTIFPCNLCNKTYSKEALLTQHLKSHDSKQWECDVCFKSFTTKYFLKKHKRLHTGEMPYTCAICSKSFTFQQSYHKHLLYHSDEKPHSCNECGRAFKELSTLHNHQRIHTGEKPWACETCGKCFRQRVSYLVHRRIHTGAMPYQCTVCLKSFRYKVSQRTHKCVALSAVETASQTAQSDNLQHMLQSSVKEVELQPLGAKICPIPTSAFKKPPITMKNQLQQLDRKQDNEYQKLNGFLHAMDAMNTNNLVLNSCCDPPLVTSHLRLDQQSHLMLQQAHPNQLLCSTSKNGDFDEFQSMQHVATAMISDAPSSGGHNSCLDVNLDIEGQERESKNISDVSSSLPHTIPASSADFNIDLLQDILSMVMSPSSESTPSPSAQMRHLSLTNQNDDDLESGLELRQLLYGSCESESTP